MRKKFLKSVLAAALSGAMLLSCPAMGSVSFAAAEDVTEEAAETEIAEPEENQEALSDGPEMDWTEDAAAEEVKTEETNTVTEDSLTSEEKSNEAEIQALSAENEIVAYASTDVAINEANFPDAVFRQYVKDEIDTDGNGKLSQSEISNHREIYCSEKGISSLKGIEIFYNLESLYCSGNKLTSLNVSKNTKLVYLYCAGNKLTSLDVTKNTQLKILSCGEVAIIPDQSENAISSLDVSQNLLLRELYCSNNNLSKLDVSKNKDLQVLECANNHLTSLNVTQNVELTDLKIGYLGNNGVEGNAISSLDLSKNLALRELDCSHNNLSKLDISKNTELAELFCDSNNLSELNISKNLKLRELWCDNNHLKTLDISKHTGLRGLYCNNNNLSHLDVSKNLQLSILMCHSNKLTSLDVSQNKKLEMLTCSDNKLTNLDVSKNTLLKILHCANTELTSINVSSNTQLRELDCSGNKLTSLNVSKNRLLEALYCIDNQLSSLNISNNTKLSTLYCDNNKLSNLDISKCPDLEGLACSNNNLSSLDIRKNLNLGYVFCCGNRFDSVDTSQNTKLNLIVLLNMPKVNTPEKVSSGVKVSWGKSIGADGYYIYRRTKGGSWSKIAAVTGENTLSYTDQSASGGQSYEYTVRGYFNFKISGGYELSDYDKNGKSITIPASSTASLGKPTVNTLTKVSNGVKVSWSKVSGATSYYVYRRTKGGSWSRLAEVKGGSTVSYTDTSVKAGTTYEYTVRAYDGKTLGDYDKNGKSITIPASTTTTIGKPTVNTPTKVSNGVKVTWSKVSGASSYYVYRRIKGGSWSRIAEVKGGSTVSYTDISVKAGTTYDYTVRAYDGKTLGDYDKNGKSISIPASTTSIGKPTVNTPTKVSNGVKVSWSKVSGANSYYVYRRTKGGSWSRLAIVNGGSTVSYTDTSVKAGTTYEYTVRAYDGKTLGDYDKNGKSITIPASSTTSLGKPTVNTPTKVSNGVKVTWSKVSGANSYYVYRRVKGGSWDRLAIVNGGSTVSYTDTSVKAGTTYEYTVRAYDGKTLGDYDKNGKSITIPAATAALGKPTVNTPTKVSNGVKVTWSKVSGANSYYVYRRTKGGSWSRLAVVNGGSTVSYTDTTVKAGTTYEYTVRAYDGKTLGDYDKNGKSITIPATTAALGKPTVNTPTKVSNGVKVSWSKVSGANSYYVYRRVKGGSWDRLAIVNGGSTVSYTDTTVKAGTTYEYTVRAYDGKTLGDYDKNGKSIAVTK